MDRLIILAVVFLLGLLGLVKLIFELRNITGRQERVVNGEAD